MAPRSAAAGNIAFVVRWCEPLVACGTSASLSDVDDRIGSKPESELEAELIFCRVLIFFFGVPMTTHSRTNPIRVVKF